MQNQRIDIHKELNKEIQDRKEKHNGMFYKDAFISIQFDKANNWLYVDWTGYQSEESIMNGGEKMLEAMKKFGTTKVLNDNTRVIGIWTPAAKWAGEVWFPEMLKAGLKYFAWIYSPSRLSQVSTDETIKHTEQADPIRTFYDLNEAKEWLRKVKSEK